MRAQRLFLLLDALALAACGAPDPHSATDPDADVALVAASLGTGGADAAGDPACGAASIEWSSPTSTSEACRGPWEYERHAFCSLADPACGPLHCPSGADGTPQYGTCARWEFGSVSVRDNRSGPERSAPQSCAYDRELRRVMCMVDHQEALAVCGTWMNQRADEIRAGLPADRRNQVSVSNVGYRVLVYPAVNRPGTMQCTGTLHYPRAASRKDPACGCAVAQVYPTCSVQRPACGPSGVRVASAPGLTRAQLTASDPHGAFGAAGSHAPSCSTGEQLPATSAAQARAKYDFLRAAWDRLPGARNTLARNIRQLYELRGDVLPPGARAFARALYRDHPYAPFACGDGGASIVPIECGDEAAIEVRAAIGRCGRLAAGHSPATLAALELGGCADALALAAALPASCAGEAARDALRESTTTLAARALALIERPAAQQGDGLGALPRQLHLIDRWDTAMRASYAPDASELRQGEPRAVRSELLGRFWRHALAQRAVLSDLAGAGAAVESALEEATTRGLALDRDVVVAAHSPLAALPAVSVDGVVVEPAIALGRAPLTGPLLLAVTSDALTSLEDRLADLSVFHDFACQFARCDAAPAPTRLARFYAVLAALDDAQELAAELAALPSGEQLDGWRPAFAAVRAGHAGLAEALTEAGVTLPIADVASVAALAPEALGLTRLVLDAERRSAAFASTGLLDPIDRRTLFAGVDDRQREVVLAAVRASMGRLERAADDYEGDLVTVVNGVLGEVGTDQVRQRIRGERERIARQIDRATDDVAGLQRSASAEDQRYGELGAALTGLDGALDSGQFVPVGGTEHLVLDGTSAQWSGTQTGVDQIASTMVQAESGELVGIATSGLWSPTCALRATPVQGPNGTIQPLDTTGVVTGPEGFSLVVTNGQAHAESASYQSTSSGSFTIGAKAQACAGYDFWVVEAEACVYSDIHQTWSRTDSEGHSDDRSTSYSSQFAAGLRLPSTPFPTLPAGSLLVVEMPRGETSPRQIRDVHVVRAPYAQILVSQPADLYVVTNDRACGGADTVHDLTVDLRRFQSQTAFGQAVVSQMADTLAMVRSLEPLLVAQGSILPSQLGEIRSQAIVDLQSRSGRAYATFPSPLAGLFEAFLDREIVRLERAVQIEAIDRHLDTLALELELLRQEELLAERQGRIAQLVPGWTLRNLDGDRLREQARDLVTLSRRHLYPVLDLWYPEALDGLNVTSAAAPLLAASPTVRTLDLVQHVRAVLDATLSRLEAATPGYKATPHRPIIAVSFLRPGVQPGPFTPVSSLPKADEQRSATLWADVEALEGGTITIRPEDVYTRFGGAGGLLACTEAVPVIQRMALYVVRPGGATDTDDLNDERRFLTGRASVTQPFAEQHGPVTYTLGNAVWQQFQVPVLYGTYTGALSTFVQRALTSAAAELPEGAVGLSPFGSVEIDFQGLTALRGGSLGDGITTPGLEATEIVLLMQVDSRSTGAPLSWVPQCAP